MKIKIPTPDEVKKLITAAEELQQLERTKAVTAQQLKEVQQKLRQAIATELLILDNPNDTLKQRIALLNKRFCAPPRSPDLNLPVYSWETSELIESEKQLNQDYDEIEAKLTAGFNELNPVVTAVCQRVNKAKMADYETLLQEIAGKLMPYCQADQSQAVTLAQQTSAATNLFRQACSCDRIIYGKSNVLAPLQAVLRVITA